MDWYWCIAHGGPGSKESAHRFQAKDGQDAVEKATEWWKQENGGLKSDFFAVAKECYFHERKVKQRAFRERWKPKQ